ncbi:hypothetical protein [Flavihumibacter sp. UBA7668]|uniref:hypothetical protein n=1 Tax=Flavihumibacter sp. UBA7668 TaxID=1946542 RepID=UPI0025C66508|nr:hypothetical protein [Flavihumibacter sp. UBA7668]
MKYFFHSIIITITLAACSSCNKSGKSTQVDKIIGTWELRSAQSGMVPGSNYSPGNGNRLVFTETEYRLYSNNQLTKTGMYYIDEISPAREGECLDTSLPRITYDQTSSDTRRFEFKSDDTVIFYGGCAALDYGTYAEYKRILSEK